MFWQIFLTYGLLVVPSLGLVGSAVVAWVEKDMLQQVDRELCLAAAVLQETVHSHLPIDAQEKRLARLRTEFDVRITLLAPDGRVVEETDRQSHEMDNHAQRPEIEEARTTGTGRSTRSSATLGETMMYVVRRVDEPDEQVAFVRVARPVTAIRAGPPSCIGSRGLQPSGRRYSR